MSSLKPRYSHGDSPAGALSGARRAPLRLVRGDAVPVAGLRTEPTPTRALSGAGWARQFRTRLQLTDAIVIIASVTLAFLTRISPTAPATLAAPVADAPQLSPLPPWSLTAVVIVTWIVALAALRTADTRVVAVGSGEYRLLVTASGLAFGVLATVFLLLGVDTAGAYFIVALPVGVITLVLERWLWRQWLVRQRTFGHYLMRALVVGSREDVEYVVRQIGASPEAAYQVVGVAVEGEDRTSVVSIDHAVPVVSDLTHVAAAARTLGVDAVIVAGQPSLGATFLRDLRWDLEKTSAELVLSHRLTDVAGARLHLRPVAGLPLIHVATPRYEGVKHAFKRLFDLLLGTAALVLVCPLFVLIALLVKLDSPGPVLFRQERVGRNGQTFRIVKVRTMAAAAENELADLLDQNEGAGVLFKIRDDPRVTRIGRFLRKYSLDELPQLWNIVCGQMSLVGPRPPLPTEVLNYESHVYRRLFLKPGLTGIWQVSGRSNLSWAESVQLDLYYVENWSLTGDLMILWRTVRTVVRAQGAY